MAFAEQDFVALAASYIRFAEIEAHGRSALYEELARGVAGDQAALKFLLGLPVPKRQPNLLFAAVRYLFGTAADWPQFRRMLLDHPDDVGSIMLSHSTQTNEPARCATLLPVLARLPQPLALIEVGASAGLCLLPDYYGYDYGHRILASAAYGAKYPVFRCAANAATPLPAALPQIVWRAGLDLNPLDVSNRENAAWLEALVWPEQLGRLANLKAAMKLGALAKPRIVKGDLLDGSLAELSREAPKGVKLVIFHTAVVAYVRDLTDRRAFAERVMTLCDFWVSNEDPGVFPDIAAKADAATPQGESPPLRSAASKLMAVNGSPVAWTDPHGASIEWIERAAS